MRVKIVDSGDYPITDPDVAPDRNRDRSVLHVKPGWTPSKAFIQQRNAAIDALRRGSAPIAADKTLLRHLAASFNNKHHRR